MTTVLASQKAYFERLDASKYRADAPCDTGMTWMMLDNLAHCVDSAHQYRVNFVDHVGLHFQGGETYRAAFSGLFPVTIARDGRWPNFHVKVAARYEAPASYVMQVRFGLATPLGPMPVRSAGPGVLGYLATAIASGPTPAWVIDDFIEDINPDNGKLTKVPIPGIGGGLSSQATGQHVMARWTVELELENNEGSASGYLHGLQVREYPSS